MFKIVRGSTFGGIFDNVEDYTIIAHGCNTHGVMGAGIAKTIKDRYPDAAAPYFKKYHDNKGILELGDVIYGPASDKLVIANCITQHLTSKTQRFVNYAALVKSLLKVVNVSKATDKQHGFDVRFPLIGGGLGGGNYNFLLDIYSDIFDNTDVNGTLYLLKD